MQAGQSDRTDTFKRQLSGSYLEYHRPLPGSAGHAMSVGVFHCNSYPMLRHIFADGGYAGPKLRDALNAIGRWTVQIVKRSDTADGFEILPRRWVVERTFAWLNRCRRLSKDWEKSIASAEAWILIAHIRRVTRYLARF